MSAFSVGFPVFLGLLGEGEDRRRFVSRELLGPPEDTYFCWRGPGRKFLSWPRRVRGWGINSDSVCEVPSAGDVGRFIAQR